MRIFEKINFSNSYAVQLYTFTGYHEQWASIHGSLYGSIQSVVCPNNGAFTGITFWFASYVVYIQFICTSSDGETIIGPFGGYGGSPVEFRCQPGYIIGSLFGNSSSVVNGLGIRCVKYGDSDIFTESDTFAIAGDPFHDGSYNTDYQRPLEILVSTDKYLTGIQVKYGNVCAFTTTTTTTTTTTSTTTTTTREPETTRTPCKPATTTCKPISTPKPTRTPPCWKAGIDKYIRKCKAALKCFVGPTYKPAKTILDALVCFISKLELAAESSSLIISTKSVEILVAISQMASQVGITPQELIITVENTFHTACNGYRSIILSLESTLGVSTFAVRAVVSDLEVAVYQIIADYKCASPLDENIDYTPVLKCIQKLTNAVAALSEKALENCGRDDDDDIRDCLHILVLVLDDLVIKAQITNVCIASEINARCGSISNPWTQCLNALDNLLNGITKALSAILTTVVEAVASLVQAIVDIAKSLNLVLKSVFGLVGGVAQGLTKTVTGTLSGLTNILKGK